MNLKDKVVVITGGSKGLGKSLASLFVKEGSVVVISSHNQNDLENTAKEINVKAIVADITKEQEVKDLAEQVVKDYGRIDIWINNAGIWLPRVSIEELNWERAHQLMEVNLFGTVFGSKNALIQMRKQGSGSIVNIISTSGLNGKAGGSAYCASKYAVVGFTNSLREETKETNIKVISIYPGGMRTNFFDEKKPTEFEEYMDPKDVAGKIIENLKKENQETELVIKRPTA